jgi:hypothetical protein
MRPLLPTLSPGATSFIEAVAFQCERQTPDGPASTAQLQDTVAGAAMTWTLPPPPPPPEPSGGGTAVFDPLDPVAVVVQVVPVPAHSPPVAPAAPPMSGAAPPAAGVLVVVDPLLPAFEFVESPRPEPDPPPCARATLPLPNVAAPGEASKTPPPLPAPPLPLLVTEVDAPGEYPPAALR